MMQLYNETSFQLAELTTKIYSTSFYSASNLLTIPTKKHIFNLYAFVRLADEIVDTMHDYDKQYLLQKFEADYYEAVHTNISTNPILHAFQLTVNSYGIPDDLIQAFLSSMKSDLAKKEYLSKNEIDSYIYGSADVVGIMCLKIFCNNNTTLFESLKPFAIKLGSAFQKVNFLRDLKDDMDSLERIYFPELTNNKFDEKLKDSLVYAIENDFLFAFEGIKQLPKNSKLAVLTAYYYYWALLQKIKQTKANKIRSERIRINGLGKSLLLLKSIFYYYCKLV